MMKNGQRAPESEEEGAWKREGRQAAQDAEGRVHKLTRGQMKEQKGTKGRRPKDVTEGEAKTREHLDGGNATRRRGGDSTRKGKDRGRDQTNGQGEGGKAEERGKAEDDRSGADRLRGR